MVVGPAGISGKEIAVLFRHQQVHHVQLSDAAAGLVVTLNSDDPAMFGTSLENEFLEASRCFGFSRETLTALCLNAARASFLGEDEKQKLCEEITRAGNL